MINIQSVHKDDPPAISAARDLFRAYGTFLRQVPACSHSFDFSRFEGEIETLPAPYTDADGDLLLARSSSGPAGCIALRSADPQAAAGDPGSVATCELKRLFVLPTHRGQGVAELLVRSALAAALRRGYQHAILDTEPTTMGAAHALYRKLGFREFQPEHRGNPVNVIYLRKPLP